MTAVIDDQTPAGLTSEEVHSRLEKFGPNAVPDMALHPLRSVNSALGTGSLNAGSCGRAGGCPR